MPENCQNQWELPEDVSLRVQLRIQSLDIYIYFFQIRELKIVSRLVLLLLLFCHAFPACYLCNPQLS